MKNAIIDRLSFCVISTSPQTGKWPLIPSAQAPRDDVARLSAFFLAPSVALLAMAGRSADKSRTMFVFLSALFLSAVSVFAESYSNRPTASEMSGYVMEGIVCGKVARAREIVVNRSQSFLPYCGVWQPYIVSLQQELETLAPMYIDHENGPLTGAGNAFLYFTLNSWRDAANLNTNGFRRSTDGTTFYYGQMQDGDIIGSWIFDDLAKGFDELKWSGYQPEKCNPVWSGRSYLPPPGYTNDLPHPDNPWVISNLNNASYPVDVYGYTFTGADDYCTINGVMKQVDRYSGNFKENGLLFSLNGINTVTIKVFDSMGNTMGFVGAWLAKWDFSNP